MQLKKSLVPGSLVQLHSSFITKLHAAFHHGSPEETQGCLADDPQQ
jgi:hypothetical protein